MLILTRRVGETVVIGDSVAVTVLAIKGNQIRLGVRAPRDVAVHREEVRERIQAEEIEAEGAEAALTEVRFSLPSPTVGGYNPAPRGEVRRGNGRP